MLAWAMISSWYLQMSGMGMSQKRAWLMNPPQSKKDSDVMFDVQVWMDEWKDFYFSINPGARKAEKGDLTK